jgi:hypothetical protein
LLAERGLIDIEDLDRKKERDRRSVGGEVSTRGIGAAYQDPEHGKYALEGSVEIDWPSWLRLCKAACCRLRFALSHQDVEEGIDQRGFSRPYFIARGENGYCRHLDRLIQANYTC